MTDDTGHIHGTIDQLQSWLLQQLTELDKRGQRRSRTVTRSGPGWCERNGRRLLNFASNDYLGLSHHPRVREALATVATDSAGSGASALVTGRTEWHERLERTIAEFEGTEAALVFPSGYAANVGTLSALIGTDDIVFSDRLNHASLIDGCRLSGAHFRVFRNDQLDKLNDRLGRVRGRALAPRNRGAAEGHTEAVHRVHPSPDPTLGTADPQTAAAVPLTKAESARRVFILTDAVFSMDGTIAPLTELCDIAERHGAIVIVDEAHGTGILGQHGRGASELCGVEHRVHVRIGTLSKAIGCLGGFVAGSRELIDYLWHSARSQFFSTALPPAVCAAAVAAFDVIHEEPDLRKRMVSNTQLLTDLLSPGPLRIGRGNESPDADAGMGPVASSTTPTRRIEAPLRSTHPSSPTSQSEEEGPGSPAVPIVPVVVGSEATAVEAARRIEQDGFLVACVRPPTVPNNTSRLRISVSASHTEQDIRRLAESVDRAVASVQRGNR